METGRRGKELWGSTAPCDHTAGYTFLESTAWEDQWDWPAGGVWGELRIQGDGLEGTKEGGQQCCLVATRRCSFCEWVDVSVLMSHWSFEYIHSCDEAKSVRPPLRVVVLHGESLVFQPMDMQCLLISLKFHALCFVGIGLRWTVRCFFFLERGCKFAVRRLLFCFLRCLGLVVGETDTCRVVGTCCQRLTVRGPGATSRLCRVSCVSSERTLVGKKAKVFPFVCVDFDTIFLQNRGVLFFFPIERRRAQAGGQTAE